MYTRAAVNNDVRLSVMVESPKRQRSIYSEAHSSIKLRAEQRRFLSSSAAASTTRWATAAVKAPGEEDSHRRQPHPIRSGAVSTTLHRHVATTSRVADEAEAEWGTRRHREAILLVVWIRARDGCLRWVRAGDGPAEPVARRHRPPLPSPGAPRSRRRSVVDPLGALFHRRQAPSLPPSSPPPSSLAATELLRRRQAPSLAVAEPPTAELPAPPPRLELLDLRYFTVDLSPDHITKVKSTGHCCSAFDARTHALVAAGDAEQERRQRGSTATTSTRCRQRGAAARWPEPTSSTWCASSGTRRRGSPPSSHAATKLTAAELLHRRQAPSLAAAKLTTNELPHHRRAPSLAAAKLTANKLPHRRRAPSPPLSSPPSSSWWWSSRWSVAAADEAASWPVLGVDGSQPACTSPRDGQREDSHGHYRGRGHEESGIDRGTPSSRAELDKKTELLKTKSKLAKIGKKADQEENSGTDTYITSQCSESWGN
uniref:Uncharacterized protein n=1 Tax=Oryza rufipogon TaxID=4529 RepID=A0A0E0P4Q8_ORYRU